MKKLYLLVALILAIAVLVAANFYKPRGLILIKSYPSSISDPTNNKFAFAGNDGLFVLDVSKSDAEIYLYDNFTSASNDYIIKNGNIFLLNGDSLLHIEKLGNSIVKTNIELPQTNTNHFNNFLATYSDYLIVAGPIGLSILEFDQNEIIVAKFIDFDDYADATADNVVLRGSELLYQLSSEDRGNSLINEGIDLNDPSLEQYDIEYYLWNNKYVGVTLSTDLDQNILYTPKLINENLSISLPSKLLNDIPLEFGKNNIVFAAVDNGLVMVDVNDPEDSKLLDVATYSKKYNEDRPSKIIVKGKRAFLIHSSGIEEYIYK